MEGCMMYQKCFKITSSEKKMSKNVKKWFDLHSFSYFGALCAVRLLFLKYCLTVATAMMSLKKAAAAFL